MDRSDVNLFCFNATRITSSGYWGEGKPHHYSVPLLLVQLTLIFAATRVVHAFLRPLGQPQVVSHVIAGIILGPSVVCRNQGLIDLLFPPRSWTHLNIISFLSYILFIFVIGVKTDLRIIRRSGKKVLAIAGSSYVFPFFCLLLLSSAVARQGVDLPASLSYPSNLVFFSRWSITSNVVLACLLDEHNLLNSKLGRLAMASSLVVDFCGMILKSTFSLFFNATLTDVVRSMLALLALVAVIVLVARRLVMWMIKNTPDGEVMGEAYLVTVILIALLCGLLGAFIGQNMANGALLLGLVLPGGPPLGRTLVERLDRLVSGLLLPVYTAVVGLRLDVRDLVDQRLCLYLALLVGFSVVAKVGAIMATSHWFGMSINDGLVIGLMLNCQGIVELYAYNSWHDNQAMDAQMYAICVLLTIGVGGVVAAVLKLVYNPASQFGTYKRLSIKQNGRLGELRVLACAHDEHSAVPIITIVETALPNPTCVYLLHLIPLIGQMNTVLTPYKKKFKKKGFQLSTTDHIVNAFHNLEKNNPGRLSVMPFVAVSPYASMHNDICQLAVDKKIALILIDFHKRAKAKGAAESIKPAIRVMNINVLHYAPCSVAIFVDHGLSPQDRLSHSIAVYFFGGVDDREALAYADCMVDNEEINVTLIRLVLPERLRDGSVEERIDDEAVDEFIRGNRHNKRVDYREEEVTDGPETVGVIRETSNDYGLLIVGRRVGEKAKAFTAGLEMWSEYPELGVIGDLLASTDLGSKVSTLVLQKQPSANGEQRVRSKFRCSGGDGDLYM
ncbi:cation/H(+) antiporter 15-like [Iris pallida]|uniref:Cation/H(+) antiporter 15-like n=1 Tax=Iris pallida TaxID=29817 RepID=A0AAX6HVM8_IRIPA|nr:cation/H(+) antiporter 15-like [Iris pallida]